MKKIIRMTESDLTNLVKRVMQEQATEKLLKPSSTSKTSQDGKLKMVDTMSKSDSSSWFSNFPCLNDVPQSKRPMVNGKIVLKTNASGQPYILLPESGKGDPNYKYTQQYKPVNNYVGQLQGGGVYYCSSEAYAKGFGPQVMTPVK
jgi:hypothetical protein